MVAEVSKFAGIEAAKIAGEDPEMDRVAALLMQFVRAEAAKHNDSGTFSRSLIVQRVRGKRGVTDREVVSTDPLAAAKEFGHFIRNEPDGPVLGRVRGNFTMRNAIKRLPGDNGA